MKRTINRNILLLVGMLILTSNWISPIILYGANELAPEVYDNELPPDIAFSADTSGCLNCAAVTDAPILLSTGAVTENVTDLSIPSPLGKAWSHPRSYYSNLNSGNGEEPTGLNGAKWFGGMQTMLLRQISNSGDIVLRISSTSSRRFTGANGTYTAPTDYNATLVRTGTGTSDEEYTLTLNQTGEVYVFYGFASSDSNPSNNIKSWLRGKLKERTSRYFQTNDASDIYGETYYYNTRGLLLMVMTALPQNYCIIYNYNLSGSAINRLKSINVHAGPSATGPLIAKAEYTYYEELTNPNSYIGSPGDLVQVKVSKRLSDTLSWQTRTTQYRYYNGTSTTHLLKMVIEPEAIATIIANNSDIATEEALFTKTDTESLSSGYSVKQYASRSFEYYSSDENTSSSLMTSWGSENLSSQYGGSNVDETTITNENSTVSIPRVKKETINASCASCGGNSSSGGMSKTYYYMTLNTNYMTLNTNVTSYNPNVVCHLIIEDSTGIDGTAYQRKIYSLNQHGTLLREITIKDPTASTLQTHCLSYIRNSQEYATEERSASVHASVTTNSLIAQFLNPHTSEGDANDLATMSSNSGLITVNEYNATYGYKTDTKVKIGSGGDEYYQSATDYNSNGIVTAEYEYPTKTTDRDASDRIATTYSYTFWDVTSKNIKTLVQTKSAISANEGGNGQSTTTSVYYDNKGHVRWKKDAAGVVSYKGYNTKTGGIGLSVTDVNTSSLPSIITTGTTEIELWSGTVPFTRNSSLATAQNVTTYQDYDGQGRVICTTNAAGIKSYTVYGNNVTYQFNAWNTTNSRPLLPISVTETDDGGKVIASYQVAPSSVTVSGGKPTGISSSATKVSLTRFTYDAVSGNRISTDRYHTIPASGMGTLGTNFYRTNALYDPLGRTIGSVQYVSNGRYQVNVRKFDWLSRPIETLQGVSTASSMPEHFSDVYVGDAYASYLVTMDKNDYDLENRVVCQKSYFDSGTNDYTGVYYHYDIWGRLRGTTPFAMVDSTETPYGPYTVQDYDWRGNVTSSAAFETEPTWDGLSETYAATTTASRRSLSKNYYNAHGNSYRTEEYQVSSDGSAGNCLRTNTYYDAMDRSVGTETVGGISTEMAYDALGRVYQSRSVKALKSTKYLSGQFQYCSPTPKPNLANLSGSGGGVITVNHTAFDTSGNAIAQHSLDLNAGIETGISTSSPNYVRQTVYSWYDAAGRPTTQANYGSGATTWVYATLPARPTTAPTTSSASVLVTLIGYNASSGRQESMTDSMGKTHKTFYDALGRTLYQVQNWTSYTPGGSGSNDSDKDVVVGNTYNGLDQTVNLTAYNATTGNQITRYLYEDAIDASLETSAIYPDSSDTNSNGADQVKTTYYRDGQENTITDQNGTVHTYAYDAQRRLTSDSATTLGTGINGSIRSIARTYDILGRLSHITSYSGVTGTGNVVNDVLYTYDVSGRLSTLYQNANGAATTSSKAITYAYDDSATNGVLTNNGRRSSMTYPNGTVVNYGYGTDGTIDDLLNRTKTIAQGATTLATYSNTGSGSSMSTTYNVPNISLNYANGGMDRFGRVIDHHWKNSSNTTIARIQHGYDYAGNRTYRKDNVLSNADELYNYDAINQVTGMNRGVLRAVRKRVRLSRAGPNPLAHGAV